MPRQWRPKWIVQLTAGIFLVAVGPSLAQAPEYAVKAAFLLNFGKFCEWPAVVRDRPTVELCVLGEDPFGHYLDEVIEHQTVQGKPLKVRRIGANADAQSCQILFVSNSGIRSLGSKLESVSRASVLSVGESPDFLDQGGIIQFELRDRRVRFDVNLEAAARANLKLSSQLIKLASRVIPAATQSAPSSPR